MRVSMPALAGKSSGRGLPAPSVVSNGELLQFCTKPDGGFTTFGIASKGRNSVHNVWLVSPGTTPDQS